MIKHPSGSEVIYNGTKDVVVKLRYSSDFLQYEVLLKKAGWVLESELD